MLRRRLLLTLLSLMVPLASYAQTPLLLDPAQAPITLKGGWKKRNNGGDIVVRIEAIEPDASFEGRLDFYNQRSNYCQAENEPIKEGRITADTLTVKAVGGAPTVCGLMTLVFRRGARRFLEGTLQTEASSGARMWLREPK